MKTKTKQRVVFILQDTKNKIETKQENKPVGHKPTNTTNQQTNKWKQEQKVL